MNVLSRHAVPADDHPPSTGARSSPQRWCAPSMSVLRAPGWIEGVGSLEKAEVALFDHYLHAPKRRRARPRRPVRRGGARWNIALQQGDLASAVGHARPRVPRRRPPARRTAKPCGARPTGLVELRVTAFDDLPLVRVFDDRTGTMQARNPVLRAPALGGEPPRLAPPAPAGGAATRRLRRPPRSCRARRLRRPPRSRCARRPPAPAAEAAARRLRRPPWSRRALLHRLRGARRRAATAAPGPSSALDGRARSGSGRQREPLSTSAECTGDQLGWRARSAFRQERDGRVREVSLTMLRIEPPTVDVATGRKQFRLGAEELRATRDRATSVERC